MKRNPLRITVLLLLVGFCATATFVSAGNRRVRTRRARNKGAGVSKAIVEQYKSNRFEGLPYRLLAPADYDPAKKYPLILSLHGAGGVGDDNLSNLRNWNAVFVGAAWRKKYPCFVVAPQSPSSWPITGDEMPELSDERMAGYSEFWRRQIERRKERSTALTGDPNGTGSLSVAIDLVEKLANEYSVDSDRIYVLGHSMGGFGSWNAIWARPDLFAAAVPTAGGLMPWKDWGRFAKVPVWSFHGAADPVVSVQFTREIFGKMKELKGNMKFTELKGVPHSASKHAFAYKGDDPDKGYVTQCSGPACDKTEDIWQWLFRQRRQKK
ncbi:MAG: prolyl oligopeptidase family serine peptidase [Phycisphaerae bacterium]|nr:prolyl oligopeptidase family serine peptidase [Phycisphaerae bacterium]